MLTMFCMQRTVTFWLLVSLGFLAPCSGWSAPAEKEDSFSLLKNVRPAKAPETKHLLLQKGDRLAICGDSITEQRMYSRIMETYLTVCVPELEVTVRQYGWSGERTPGFVDRMASDCLRFKPTIATTCYGMNDHEYRPFELRIGRRYRNESETMVEMFKSAGSRVVLGSPGCVGKMPSWVSSAAGTIDDLNASLCTLRNIDIDVSREEHVAFADVFWPMLTAGVEGKKKFGADFAIAGKDGVHPGWAGHLVMAYAFLKGLGLDGQIGTITVDLSKKQPIGVTRGHELLSGCVQPGEFRFRSTRYPFCATNTVMNDGTIRAGMALVPFNEELNRFMLVAKNGSDKSYRVTWGEETRTYSAAELSRGVNLARDFVANPFWRAFNKVDEAVAAKQEYETRQIKQLFRSKEAKTNLLEVIESSEAARAKLAAEIKAAFAPVEHTLRIEPGGA